jgi:hypothetical protein
VFACVGFGLAAVAAHLSQRRRTIDQLSSLAPFAHSLPLHGEAGGCAAEPSESAVPLKPTATFTTALSTSTPMGVDSGCGGGSIVESDLPRSSRPLTGSRSPDRIADARGERLGLDADTADRPHGACMRCACAKAELGADQRELLERCRALHVRHCRRPR